MREFALPALAEMAGPAFDWLCQELELPSEHSREMLRQVFIDLYGQPSRSAARKLQVIWPEGAEWKNGQDWVSDSASGLQEDDLLFLLHVRHSRVTNRLYRHAQIRSMIHPDSPDRISSFTQVMINKLNLNGTSERNICGLKYGQVMSIEAGLVFMQKPAHRHPECDCTIDPIKAKRV